MVCGGGGGGAHGRAYSRGTGGSSGSYSSPFVRFFSASKRAISRISVFCSDRS